MNWEPIETAPKDGTPILGYARGDYTVVRWNKNGHYWTLCVCGTRADDGEWWPTYWLPLPPPPTDDQLRARERKPITIDYMDRLASNCSPQENERISKAMARMKEFAAAAVVPVLLIEQNRREVGGVL